MDERITTGSMSFDGLLEGGFEKDVISTIFGPAGSGKTNLCLITLANFSSHKKIIYIDTEGSFSVSRLKQITSEYKEVMSRIIFFKPTNFDEQKDLFSKLRTLVNEKTGLIIFDGVAMLYRLEIGKNKDIYNVNKELGIQLSYLSEIARKKNIPVLVTNQVYADFENKDQIKMVGGDILKYASKCLIELQKVGDARKAILRKHRSIRDGNELIFKIVNSGIEEVKKEKINPL
ncbi:MAG: DNA repair and recombination protein RadB [Nanoarchaeota archaeon]|nr:DNA repair and recombination protein RadB [Nanoarchaeota archaeon]MBU1854392.1 DNA repair and recombination protein RadB [Nanoarchaeota archaeon]